MNCARCGAANRREARFCRACGSPIAPTAGPTEGGATSPTATTPSAGEAASPTTPIARPRPLSSLSARARLTAARIGRAKPGALALGGGIVALLVLLLVARAALAAPRGTSPSMAAVQSSPSPLPAPTATVTPTINVAPTQTRAAELAVLATLSVPTMTPRPTPTATATPIPTPTSTPVPTPTSTPVPTPTSTPRPTPTVTPSPTPTSTATPTPSPTPTRVPTATSAPAATSGTPPGELLYASNKEGRWALYRIRPDGSGERRLTTLSSDDYNGVWSPDGQSIAFVSDRDGNPEIYVMNADGSGQRRLTNAPGADEAPAWSPDGRQIAFVSTRAGDGAIYLMNRDGSDPVRIINSPAGWPSWSRTGRIVFVRPVNGLALFETSLNEQGVRQLSPGRGGGPGGSDTPAHSPDGARLAYTDGPSKTDRHIIVSSADHRTWRAVTAGGADNSNPMWSPDSEWLAYSSDSGGTQQVYIIRADGSGVRAITSGAGRKWYLSWRP